MASSGQEPTSTIFHYLKVKECREGIMQGTHVARLAKSVDASSVKVARLASSVHVQVARLASSVEEKTTINTKNW